MPLSEHEQQLLDQMEQALYAEDPRFASQMQGAARRGSRNRLIVGIIGVVVGLGLILVGISTTWIIGAVGFAGMVAALAYALTPARKTTPQLGAVAADGTIRGPKPSTKPGRGDKKGKGPRSRPSGSFMERMEERWERRRNDW